MIMMKRKNGQSFKEYLEKAKSGETFLVIIFGIIFGLIFSLIDNQEMYNSIITIFTTVLCTLTLAFFIPLLSSLFKPTKIERIHPSYILGRSVNNKKYRINPDFKLHKVKMEL